MNIASSSCLCFVTSRINNSSWDHNSVNSLFVSRTSALNGLVWWWTMGNTVSRCPVHGSWSLASACGPPTCDDERPSSWSNAFDILFQFGVPVLLTAALGKQLHLGLLLTRFLPARRYASAGYRDRNVSVRPSVCPSVRPSRAGIVSKRIKLAS